jgi:AraC-like DNA-binding protein
MLKETSASIKEISEKSGFSSPGYFCKVIRKTTACSPEEYRKIISCPYFLSRERK